MRPRSNVGTQAFSKFGWLPPKKSRSVHCFQCVQVFTANCTILYCRLISLLLIQRLYPWFTSTWDLIYSWGKFIQDKKPISFLEHIHITYIHYRERRLLLKRYKLKKTIKVHLATVLQAAEGSGIYHLLNVSCSNMQFSMVAYTW